MPRKIVKGTTENLNMLNEKINYIGFKLGEVPEFLKDFEPLNYSVPRVYDETTYKVYKYISIEDLEILVTPTNRLEELSERYKYASPLFTYMSAENNENIEKYARFLKMINQTRVEDIEKIEKDQTKMEKATPFQVKFPGNFKWQIYYSDYAKKYFMLASTDEVDNSPLFYILKRKIEENKDKRKKKKKVFVPISNEDYTEKILKKSEIADLENYLWFFTKNWPSIYEVTEEDGSMSLQITGEAKVFDMITSKFNMKFTDRKEAVKEYKLIKALFILAYDIPDEFEFNTKINDEGRLTFFYKGEEVVYDNLSQFMKRQAMDRIEENIRIQFENRELKADIKDLKRHSEEQNEEYLRKERQIYTFLECKKTFFGKVRYFFKGKKKADVEISHTISKERMKDILSQDKEEKIDENNNSTNKLYTVEDMIKICKELNETIKENKNIKLDMKAMQNKIENLDRKIKNATQYIEEIEKHKKSIFEFWKFANKDEVKALEVGNEEENNTKENIKRNFNYENDIEILASSVDKKQREKLTGREVDATFAANFVLDGINILSKEKVLKKDEDKIKKLLEDLKAEYSNNMDKIESKDFDIFGNVNEDKTKVKNLKNATHRENEKDKFKILNINLDTELADFMEKLVELRTLLEDESNKIETPYDLSVYKVSTEKLDADGFDKFDLNPEEVAKKLANIETTDEVYLYKVNIPEKTNIIFYTNIMFFENRNNTLPLGMDILQETLINLDMYKLELKNKEEFNISALKDEFNVNVKKIKVYEYDIINK